MAHTPVKGYRELTEEELADMNMLKEMEANVLAELDALGEKGEHSPGVSLSKNLKAHTHTPAYTPRWLNIARTHIQQGFMAANRAIARPNNERQ